MKMQHPAPVAKVLSLLMFIACLGACRRAPESHTAGSIEPAAPALSSDEGPGNAEPGVTALDAKEATKRALESARSASAAAKNAAAAAERAAAAADAAVEAIQKIPPAKATPKPAGY